jgi:hypothetical protein
MMHAFLSRGLALRIYAKGGISEGARQKQEVGVDKGSARQGDLDQT